MTHQEASIPSKKNFYYGDVHLKKAHGHNSRIAQEHQHLCYLQKGQLLSPFLDKKIKCNTGTMLFELHAKNSMEFTPLES